MACSPCQRQSTSSGTSYSGADGRLPDRRTITLAGVGFRLSCVIGAPPSWKALVSYIEAPALDIRSATDFGFAQAHGADERLSRGPGCLPRISGVIATVYLINHGDRGRDQCAQLLSDSRLRLVNCATACEFHSSHDRREPGCVLANAEAVLRWNATGHAGLLPVCECHPVIFTASAPPAAMIVQAMKAGASDFLEEPLEAAQVRSAIDTALLLDSRRRSALAQKAELRAHFSRLTPRERQVLALVTTGKLNKQIAFELGLSEITVKVHRGSVMRKMEARSLPELVRMSDALRDAGPTNVMKATAEYPVDATRGAP